MNGYSVNNINVKILLINEKYLTASVNIIGFERFSDFINDMKEDHLKLTNVILNGKEYPFMLLNKNHVIGYFENKGKK